MKGCKTKARLATRQKQVFEADSKNTNTEQPTTLKITCTVKPILSSHSKIGKTKVLKTNGSLMKVESIAECSLGAFCNTFDLH